MTANVENKPGQEAGQAVFAGVWRHPGWLLIASGGMALAAATVLGFLGGYGWFLDLFAHFRVQYLACLLVVSVLLLKPRWFKASAFFAVMGLVNLAVILPLYFGHQPAVPAGTAPCRVLYMNVCTERGSPAAVAALIRKEQPDLVFLVEVDERWLGELREATRDYPFSQVLPREDNFGVAFFSRLPLAKASIQDLGEARVPFVTAEVLTASGRVQWFGVHLVPPFNGRNSRLRNDQMNELARRVRPSRLPVLLMGDLNISPWSAHFQRLLAESGLRDSAQGWGPLPTWPAHFPLLLTPIDHCLHSEGVSIQARERGPRVGSDHYPLLVEFAVAGQAAQTKAVR